MNAENFLELIDNTLGVNIFELNYFWIIGVVIDDSKEFSTIQFEKICTNFRPGWLWNLVLCQRLFRLSVRKHL